MPRSLRRHHLTRACCLLGFLLAACGSEWVPAEQAAPTPANQTQTPTQTVSIAVEQPPAQDVTLLADASLPAGNPLTTPSRTPRGARATRTPTQTYTPLAPEEQLATFYAESTLTATAAGTPSKGQRAPTRTRTPTPTPTITPTPLPPFAVLRIDRPGRMSKLTSPFRTELGVTPGDDGRIHIDLIGEDGRYITRQILSYGSYQGKSIGITPEIDFQIDAVAETARLVITIYDKFGRIRHLTSTDLILLSIGDTEINPTNGQREAYIVRTPKTGDIITGGKVTVIGLARPVNDSPLILELIDESGNVVGQQSITVPPPTAEISHTPFTVTIPYKVTDVTPVRLTLHQQSTTRIPGTVELATRELILAP
jgi:hypothetical protein